LDIPQTTDACERAQIEMSRSVSDLTGVASEVVRLLPLAVTMIAKRTGIDERWRRSGEFRLICDCQHHARRDRTLLRRSVRGIRFVAQHVSRGTLALIVGVPLAFGAVNIPLEGPIQAMTAQMHRIRAPKHDAPTQPAAFPIFTTARVRRDFLAPNAVAQTFSLDVAKEDFFRSQVPYGSIIFDEARRNRLSPELVAAVVETESDFRPRLVSQKNAQGLMQIIPSTGRLLGAEDLFNPAQNIAAGAKYLRYLHDRFGDERVALAAYNAGEGNVEKFGGIPPFPETQNYLTRVASRARLYRERVNGRYVSSLRMRNDRVVQ
jgi:hypothetical protein